MQSYFGPPRVPKGQLADVNVKRAVTLAHLHRGDVARMYTIFKRWDVLKNGTVAINDLFAGVLNEERNLYTG